MTTVRTIKLKRSPQIADTVPEDVAEGTPVPEAGMTEAESSDVVQASMASIHAHTDAPMASTKSYLWFMVMALLAVIGIGVIIGLQYSEWTFYGADPSVWLKK